MNDDFDGILILEETKLQLRNLAQERKVPMSELIHEALGEYLLARTMGENIFDMLHCIESTLSSDGRYTICADPESLVVIAKSPLRYVHRPEIKYEIRIQRNEGDSVGRLNVILRTHNIEMIRFFAEFVNKWIELEQKYLMKTQRGKIMYKTDSGYFARQIKRPIAAERGESRIVGEAISNYVDAFDKLLKHYYEHWDTPNAIEALYILWLEDGKLTI